MSRSVNFAVVGLGGVGRALVEAVVAGRAHHLAQYGLTFNACLVADSSGALVAATLDDAALLAACATKSSGGALKASGGPACVAKPEGQTSGAFITEVVGRLGAGTIVVDCTATDATAAALVQAIAQGKRVVSANKKPFSIEQATYDALVGSPRHLNLVRYESTVGAGLPAVAALARLAAANDPVRRIAGTFSGTLGYVMTGLQQGRKFSEIVIEAKALGYTEPDPRDDLGGVDVARKALILARGMGWRLEMSDVAVTPLYPEAMASLSVADFMAALPSLDEDFSKRSAAGAADGKALRYAANIEGGKMTVGPTLVALDSPLGSLSGTDNLVEYYTQWYNPSPLVVRGAGAGAGTTAAGCLADMVELSFCL